MQGTDDGELKRRMAELTNALQAVGRYTDNSAADDTDGAVDAGFLQRALTRGETLMFGYVTASAEMPEEQPETLPGLLLRPVPQSGPALRRGRPDDPELRRGVPVHAAFSLYEPEEQCGQERCLPHPMKEHEFVENPLADYAADVNLLLSYHKCMDDWQDEHRLSGRAEAGLLQKSFASIEARYPEKSAVLKRCLDEIHQVEKSGAPEPDRLANLTGEMLGTLYRWREDEWADSLEKIGQSLGRFIYLMDAYDDLEGDLHHGRYNPLRELSKQEDFEELIPAKPDAGDGGMHPGI